MLFDSMNNAFLLSCHLMYFWTSCPEVIPDYLYYLHSTVTILRITTTPPIRPPTIQFSARIPILPAIPKFFGTRIIHIFPQSHRDSRPESSTGIHRTRLLCYIRITGQHPNRQQRTGSIILTNTLFTPATSVHIVLHLLLIIMIHR